MFGTCHLLWLAGILVVCLLSGHWYRHQNIKQQETWKHIIGTLLPVLGIYRDVVLLVTGHFEADFLPLHLCSMAMWIACLYVWTKNRFVGVIYILLCLPGAAGALLFPNWDRYPLWNYMHIHAFVSHGLILMLGIWLLSSGEVIPEWNEFWMPVVFGMAGFLTLSVVNRLAGTNFWFLKVPSHGSPLVWIARLTGTKWYLAGYFLFCVLIVFLWQGVLSLWQRYK